MSISVVLFTLAGACAVVACLFAFLPSRVNDPDCNPLVDVLRAIILTILGYDVVRQKTSLSFRRDNRFVKRSYVVEDVSGAAWIAVFAFVGLSVIFTAFGGLFL